MNKNQKKLIERIDSICDTIRPLNDKEYRWLVDNATPALASIRKMSYRCMECGHVWPKKGRKPSCCPSCGKKLTYITTKNYVWYVNFVQTHHEFQVIRMFQGKQTHFNNRRTLMKCINEVMQLWIAPTGEYMYYAKRCQSMSIYFDLWILDSPLKPKYKPSQKDMWRFGLIVDNPTYRYRQIIPELKLRKYTYDNGCFNELMPLLLSNSHVETLYKAGWKIIPNTIDDLLNLWPTVRICLRNKYMPHDLHLWIDHIQMLKKDQKDILNAHYVCPENLEEEHQRLIKRMARKNKDDMLKVKAFDNQYRKRTASLRGLQITEGNITIMHLDTVMDVLYEGKLMKHCIFQNSMFNKKDKVLFTSYYKESNKDVPVKAETIALDVNYRTHEIRGYDNKNTKHHNEIVALVKKYTNQIIMQYENKKPIKTKETTRDNVLPRNVRRPGKTRKKSIHINQPGVCAC